MNKKEVAEIKKLYSPKRCSIQRIAGCYVDAEKNIKTTFNKSFLGLPEEEMFKYITIFKKSLTGTIGKGLNTLEFPMAAEEKDGTQAALLALRNSKLQNDTLLHSFYRQIIDGYSYVGNYVILLIYDVYDVPGKAKDNRIMEDASTDVYEYIMCCICSMELSKAGLGHITTDNTIGCVEQNWMLEVPNVSFLFPAFNSRCSDIHSILTYCKKPDEYNDSFIKNILGCQSELTPEEQKSTFSSVVEKTLGEECNIKAIKEVLDKLQEAANDHKEDETPFVYGKEEIQTAIATVATNEQIESFTKIWNETAGTDTTFAVPNIIPKKTLNIKTPEVSIKVNTDRTDLVQEKIIDGKKYLLIQVDGAIEYNGISIKESISSVE